MQTNITANYDEKFVVGNVFADSVYIHAGELKKGSVLASRGIASADAKAKKSITFTGTPVASEDLAITIEGVTVEVTTGSTTLATEVAAIATAINADETLGAIVTASSSSGKLLIEWDAKGKAGNFFTVEVDEGDTGLTAGDLTVETIGQLVGDELFELVDSDSATSALQKPVCVLLEDGKAGESKQAAFCGVFDESSLIFSTGDSLATFKNELRKIGIYTKKFF